MCAYPVFRCWLINVFICDTQVLLLKCLQKYKLYFSKNKIRPEIVKLKIKNPLFELKLIAVIMSLVGLVKLASFLLPMIFLRRLFIGAPFRELFSVFFEEVCETFNIGNKYFFVYLLLLSVVISCIYIISGIFLIFRKSWARCLIVYSLVIVIPLSLINYILVSLRIGLYLPSFDWIVGLTLHIIVLHFFTRPQIKQLFPEKNTGQKHSTLNSFI